MTPGEGESNVRELRPRERDPDGLPIRRRRRPPGERYCGHHHVEVGDRTLVCADCEADVDPFAFLEYLAHNLEQYTMARDRAKADAERMLAELADVKRQLRNAKAQRRRLEA